MKMAIDAQQSAKPTLRVTCPAGGCEVEYTDPRDKGNIKFPTNGYDAYMATIGAVKDFATAAIVPAAMGMVAVRGYQNLKGSGATTTTTSTSTNTATTTNTADSNNSTTTSTTASLTGSGVIGSGTNTAPTTTTTTTTTDNHSQTSTPTVVQPPPGKVCSVDPVTGALTCI